MVWSKPGTDNLTSNMKTNALKMFRVFIELYKTVPVLRLLPLFNLYLFPVEFPEHCLYQQARDQEVCLPH